MSGSDRSHWVILVVKIPADPSRHRVAVWRELRRLGAVAIAQGVWAIPDAPFFVRGLGRVVELAQRGEGLVVALNAVGRAHVDGVRMEEIFTDDRQSHWIEFLAECGRFEAQLERMIGIGRLTPSALDAANRDLERLRRWYRELVDRDLVGAPAAADADDALRRCARGLTDFSSRVAGHRGEQ